MKALNQMHRTFYSAKVLMVFDNRRHRVTKTELKHRSSD